MTHIINHEQDLGRTRLSLREEIETLHREIAFLGGKVDQAAQPVFRPAVESVECEESKAVREETQRTITQLKREIAELEDAKTPAQPYQRTASKAPLPERNSGSSIPSAPETPPTVMRRSHSTPLLGRPSFSLDDTQTAIPEPASTPVLGDGVPHRRQVTWATALVSPREEHPPVSEPSSPTTESPRQPTATLASPLSQCREESESAYIPSFDDTASLDDPRRRMELGPAVVTEDVPLEDLTKKFVSHFQWNGRAYKIEQALPSSTSQLEWEAIVTGYREVLNQMDLSAHPTGIRKLELTLDANSREMRISIPGDAEEAARGPIRIPATHSLAVDSLIGYMLTRDEGFLVSYMPYDPLPSEERALPLPTPLANPTGTNCALNSWMNLIHTNPLLQSRYRTTYPDIYKERSVGGRTLRDITDFNDSLFPPVNRVRRQQDASETILKFLGRFEDQDSLPTRTTTKTYEIFGDADPNAISQELSERGLSFERRDNHFIVTEQIPVYPTLDIIPDPRTKKNLEQAVREQFIPRKPQVGDERATINIQGIPALTLEEESTQFGRAPSTLIFHAQRNDGSVNKNAGEIELPERMALPGQFFSAENSPSYQLRGFIVHVSDRRPDGTFNPNDGHYISYVKTKDAEGKTHYYQLDDATAIGANNQEVLKKDPQKEISREEFLSAANHFTIATYNKLEERQLPPLPEAPIPRDTERKGERVNPPSHRLPRRSSTDLGSYPHPSRRITTATGSGHTLEVLSSDDDSH